jgi:hypothetical protein
VRAQLTGYRSTTRTEMSATGYRSRAEPRPDDLFALGLLSRGAVVRDGKQEGELVSPWRARSATTMYTTQSRSVTITR